MRVLMFSWEYPPIVVGGLGRHVSALAPALVAAGHEVTVVTQEYAEAPAEIAGVRVIRAPMDPPAVAFHTETLLLWAMNLNHAFTRAGLSTLADGAPDVIHAHDWMVGHAAVTLAGHTGAPLVTTVHATETGRQQGHLATDLSRAVHDIERWHAQSASRVIVCSEPMRREVSDSLKVSDEVIDVIPNGVDAAAWKPSDASVAAARTRWSADGPLLVYAGRLVYEKGVQDLLLAVRAMRRDHPGLRLVVAGIGIHQEALEADAKEWGVDDVVTFAGFLEPTELAALLGAATCVVIPSLYEPFGITTLEAAAAGAPRVVAATGGLAEVVVSGVDGLTFPPGDVPAMAAAIDEVLRDADLRDRLVEQAHRRLTDFTWPAIAARTLETYRTAGA